MLRPSYSVRIGSSTFSSGDADNVVALTTAKNMGLPIDSSDIRLVSDGKHSFKRGDEVKLKLGYDRDLKLVFTGFVDAIDQEINAVTLTALGPAAALLRLRLNRLYSSQTAGKIVRNLAQEARVKVKDASDGINLPVYIIDDGANAYQHILRLASLCNFDLYADENGELVFRAFAAAKTHTLEYGKDIVEVLASDSSAAYVGARVSGESPASFKGSDTHTWLTKQEVRGEAGGAQALSLSIAAVKDRQTAEQVAKARFDRLEYTSTIAVEVVGSPEIRLGDAVSIRNMPARSVNGESQVTGVEHYLSKTRGFTTTIRSRRKGGG